MKKNLFSFLVLSLAVTAVACDRENRSSRACTYDGSEKFGITVDGRFRGAFAEYVPAEGPSGIAILRNGLIPAATDLRNSPAEAKDVTVFAVDKGKVTSGVADLTSTKFISVNGLASQDDENCLVVDELLLEVGETKPFSGVLTAPDQNPAPSADAGDAGDAAADTAVEDDIGGGLDDDLE